MTRFALAAVAWLLLSTAGAHATEPWTAPQTVSSAAGQIPDPRIVVDAQGFTRLAWTWLGPVPDVKSGYPAHGYVAAREPGAMQFGPERDDPWTDTPVFYGRDRMLALRRTDLEAGDLHAVFGDTRGKIDFTQAVSGPYQGTGFPSLAVHRTAVAAWVEDSSLGREAVRAAIRPLGKEFGEPVTLMRGREVKGLVAASGPGAVFIAWEHGDVIEARVKRRGRPWGPVHRVGVAYGGFAPTVFKTVFSGRRAYLAWTASGPGEYTLRAAVLPGGRTRFRRAQRVDLIGQEIKPNSRPIALVPLPRRGALLGWTGWDGRLARAWTARTGRDARFGRRVSVAPPGEPAVLGDLEVVPESLPGAGTMLAVWTRLNDRGLGDRVRAAFRRPGGAFGPPEDVSDLDRAGLSVDAAFDRVGRRWTVVWPQIMMPGFVPDYIPATYLRSATRPG